LESLLFDLRKLGDGNGIGAQNFRSLKGLLSLSIVFSSDKPSHTRSALILKTVLSMAQRFGGIIMWNDMRRSRPLNAVYVKFCVYTKYCYIGETLTGTRFYNHESAPNGGYRSQKVHRVISRLDTILYDTLVINFPPSVNRKHVERTLITHFDYFGDDLLNVLLRSSTYLIFGNEPRSTRVTGLRDTIRKAAPRTPLPLEQKRRYMRLMPPTPRIHLRRRPAIILYGGGLGGVTEGLLRSGYYRVLVVVEFDLVTANIHRDRFPTIPVLQYELGNDIDDALRRLARYAPHTCWNSLFIQASPPCRKLSANVKKIADPVDAMHHVHWTLDLIARILPAGFCIENVDAMLLHLRQASRGYFTASLDLSFWVPQQRKRSFISSFDLHKWVKPNSDSPIPASAVLPQYANESMIVNRYNYARPITEPSLTIVGKPMSMAVPFDPITGVSAPDGATLNIKMPATVAMVLQGFPAGCDLSAAPSDAVRYQVVGDAVPPPFARALGEGFFRCSHPSPMMVVDAPILPPLSTLPLMRMYQVVRPGPLTPTADLAEALVEVLGENHSSITVLASAGLHDLSDSSIFNGLRGTATVFRGDTLLHVTATSGAVAICHGYTHMVVFDQLDHDEFFTYLTGRLFIQLAKCGCGIWGKQWGLLRDRSFSQLTVLYGHCTTITDVRERARMKTRITAHCKYRFKVAPSVSITFSVAAREGLSSGLIRKIIAGILTYVEIPHDFKSTLVTNMTVSFSKQRSVGDILTNFRAFARDWNPLLPPPCTCPALRSALALNNSTATCVEHDGSLHVHAFLRDCSTEYTDVLTTNLNNVCSPSSESFPLQFGNALSTVLKRIRRFACDIRQTDPVLFRHSLIKRLEGSVRVLGPTVLEWVRLITGFGFTVDQATTDLLAKLLLSQATPLDIDGSPSSSAVPSHERTRQCASFLHPLGVVYYCDKNSGLGTICCKRVAWEVYRAKFYTNPEYLRTNHTPSALTDLHRKAFTDGGWGSFSRFDEKGDGFNTPFAFPKFKDRAKYRGILSAANHQLKNTHAMVCLALRTSRRYIHLDPADCRVSNLGSTFEATSRLRSTTAAMIGALRNHDTSLQRITPLAYAGDVSSMYDKLPKKYVLLAVAHHLEKVRSKYRGRSTPLILLHRLDDDAHRVGHVGYNDDALRVVTFDHITSVCEHYVTNTFFRFALTTSQLLLGIPQGGSLSVELCFIFCMYCEDCWLASLFDFQSLTPDGIVRRHALLPSTVVTLEALGVTLPSDPSTPILALALTRYFDDCRLVVYVADYPSHPRLHGVGKWIIDCYRRDCYIKPCELEDEAYGTSFSFLQGTYVFTDTECFCLYMAKNIASFSSLGVLKYHSMQHYQSFCQDRDGMRLAVLLGKLYEINAFSYPELNIGLGILSVAPDLVLLGYPFALVKKALGIMSTRTKSAVWRLSSVLVEHLFSHLPR
jgi:site-specific DNA-cytosine methylase